MHDLQLSAESWHGDGEEYSVETLSGADTLLFGRKTYEGFAAFWPTQEGEVARLLKPGGVFVGYMLDAGHTIYRMKAGQDLPDDPGTLVLQDGKSKVYLSNIGVSHFFRREEYDSLLAGFRVIDPCLTTYYIPKAEAAKRGYTEYLQSMWTVYAVK